MDTDRSGQIAWSELQAALKNGKTPVDVYGLVYICFANVSVHLHVLAGSTVTEVEI